MVNNGDLDLVTSSPSPQVNPAIPESVGALLAEEWTINPTSTLPSFLERMMMEESRRCGWQALQSLLLVIEQRLSRAVEEDQGQDSRDHDSVGAVNGTGRLSRLYHALLGRWPRRVAKVFLQKLVRPFGPEIRFLILCVLERFSLALSDATISESLYGGRRVKLCEPSSTEKSGKRNLRPIENRDRMLLAFFMAFGPYLEERSEYFFRCFFRLCSSSSINTTSTSFTRIARKNKLMIILNVLWPLLRSTTKATFLWYRWRYLLGKTIFFDPYSSRMDLVVRRVTMEDQQKSTQQMGNGGKKKAVDPSNTRIDHIQRNLSKLVSSGELRFITGAFVSGYAALAWFARIRLIRQELQREQELHGIRQRQLRGRGRGREQNQERNADDFDSNGFISASKANNKTIPSPPLPASSSDNSSRTTSANNTRNSANSKPGVCPLCNEPRIHPTASTGGYVFCLKCILSFVRQNGSSCPVTGKSCPESSLVRLYEPTTH
eukprot:jgi/Psemu1/283137/fgenesh1_pg.20_\